MLGIDLTALNSPELRRLIERARSRGQDTLVRQLEAELSARAGRGRGPAIAMSAAMRAAAASPPPPIRRRGPAVAVAGLAAFTGAALAWGLTLNIPQAPGPQPMALNSAQPASRIAVALTTTQLPEEALNQPVEDASAPPLEGDPASIQPGRAETISSGLSPAKAADPSRNPCYDLPTNQQRLLCGYPSLAIKDRDMRIALQRARDNGSDVRAIEDAQAAWQSASVNISNRLLLAARYDRRIAELRSD